VFFETDVAPTLTPMPGSNSGESFLAEMAGERTVVRIYAARGATRGEGAAEIDAAVLRLVRGLVPVPDVLEVRRADPTAGTPALLVTSFLPGRRVDEVLSTADAALADRIGRSVGRVLSRLSQMPMLRAGDLVDGDLRITSRSPEGADLAGRVARHLDGPVLSEWSDPDRVALAQVADAAQDLLDRTERHCLVHGDLGPENLLVDPESGQVTGVVDWEHARAGSPFADLGNLLRSERAPAFTDAVLSTYADLVADSPDDLLTHARAADLSALVELASRRGRDRAADAAHDRLLAIARTGDLVAQP
jgi:aminoglycoside phosphotransferase (APT) family kinase protein